MADQNGDMGGQRRQPELAGEAKGRLRDLAHEISGQIAAVDRRRPLAPTHPSIETPGDWDAASAEALTRMYEGAGIAPAVFYADPPVAAPRAAAPVVVATPRRTVAIEMPAAAPNLADLAPTLADLAQDRAWLDGRFTDLAARIEDSMQRFDPAERLAPIGSRLDGIENHLKAALDDLVRRDAFAGLEAQVGDVKQQLSIACTRLARLDGIEAELSSLTALARAASDAPASLEQASSAPHVDIEALMHRAASYTVARLAEEPTRGANSEAVGELKALVSGYVDEYRREQSQTSAALATMQEALVRLIDRIEQYDEEMLDAPVDDPAPMTQPAAAVVAAPSERFVEVADERGQQPGRRMIDQMAAQPAPLMPPDVRAVDVRMPMARPGGTAAAMPPTAEPPVPVEAQRTPRRAPTSPVAADLATTTISAAEAMAIERARVAAERAAQTSAVRRAAAPRPAEVPQPRPAVANPAIANPAGANVVPDQAPAGEAAAAPRAKRTKPATPDTSVAKRGLMVAGIAALLIGASTFAHMFLSGRLISTAKMEDRLPAVVTGPKMTPRTPTAGQDVRPQPTTQRLPQPQPAPRDQQASPSAPLELPAEFKPKSIPETGTDDLSANKLAVPGTNPPSLAASAAMRPTQAAVQGIALDNGALPDPAELARRMLAPGAAAAQPVPAQPATLQPINAIVQPEPEVSARVGAIEIPPAQIGPTSLRMAAQQGDPSAQFEVAARFAEGKGIKQDFPLAITWYTRASQKGFIPAQYRLATLYERGLGTSADITRAKVWYRRAADQGNIKSMHNLAVLAAGPQQAEPDYPTAARWFTEAAERGLADSQFNLGVLSENGLGLTKDSQQAYKWFALAARSGDKEATRRRDQLLATFNPDQAKTAEQLVANWRAKPTDMKANDVRAAEQAWKAEQLAAQQMAQQKMNEAQQQRQAPQQSQPQQQPVLAPAAKATPVKASKTIAKP